MIKYCCDNCKKEVGPYEGYRYTTAHRSLSRCLDEKEIILCNDCAKQLPLCFALPETIKRGR